MSNEQEQLRRLERKVDRLLWIVSAQAVLLAVLSVPMLLSLLPTIQVLLLLSIPVLILFRRSLPRWGRRCGQLVAGLVWRRRPSSSNPG